MAAGVGETAIDESGAAAADEGDGKALAAAGEGFVAEGDAADVGALGIWADGDGAATFGSALDGGFSGIGALEIDGGIDTERAFPGLRGENDAVLIVGLIEGFLRGGEITGDVEGAGVFGEFFRFITICNVFSSSINALSCFFSSETSST